MGKLSRALNKIYKNAISRKEFDKFIKGNEQFAIISSEVAYERSVADEKAYKLSPVEYIGNKREFEPIEKERTKNLRQHKKTREELRKNYDIYEIDSQWAEKIKLPDDRNFYQMKKERSMFLKNISFNKAYEIAQKNGQESFIFKPHNGPVQLIPTNPSNTIRIAKKFAYSSENNLYSTFLHDNSSIWFGFFSSGAIELPNYGTPYMWIDKEIKDLLIEEIPASEAEQEIEKIRNESQDIYSEKEKWLYEKDIERKNRDKKITEILEKPEPWKGRHF